MSTINEYQKRLPLKCPRPTVLLLDPILLTPIFLLGILYIVIITTPKILMHPLRCHYRGNAWALRASRGCIKTIDHRSVIDYLPFTQPPTESHQENRFPPTGQPPLRLNLGEDTVDICLLSYNCYTIILYSSTKPFHVKFKNYFVNILSHIIPNNTKCQYLLFWKPSLQVVEWTWGLAPPVSTLHAAW